MGGVSSSFFWIIGIFLTLQSHLKGCGMERNYSAEMINY